MYHDVPFLSFDKFVVSVVHCALIEFHLPSFENVFYFRKEKSKLRLYNGYTPDEYYLNAAKENRRDVEHTLRSGAMICLGGEDELDGIMKGNFDAFNRSDCALRYNEIFRWSWETWHLAIGNKIAQTYGKTIGLMNAGANANGIIKLMKKLILFIFKLVFLSFFLIGYADIGSVWKEEVDLPNLESIIDSLMQQIKPFYELLHGVMRNVLWNQIHKFEPKFDKHSTIPAHMLGKLKMFQVLFFHFKIAFHSE